MSTLQEFEEAIFEKAIQLLEPYNKESIAHMYAYYEEQDEDGDCLEDYGSDHDTCNLTVCIDSKLAELKLEYPNKNIEYRISSKDGDNECIDHCAVCGCPLNEFMTWVKSEFEHHVEHNRTVDDFKNSSIAFDLIAMFQSMPSMDEEPSPHCIATKLDPYKDQRDFYAEVVKYAQHVIETLS